MKPSNTQGLTSRFPKGVTLQTWELVGPVLSPNSAQDLCSMYRVSSQAFTSQARKL